MAKKNPYALKSYHYDINEVLVEKNSDFDNLFEFLFCYPVAPALVLVMTIATLILPALFPFTIFLCTVLLIGHERIDVLPIALPEWSKAKRDYNTPALGGKGFQKPGGAFYLGTLLRGVPHQIFFRFESILRHILVIGTTGAGKTELLLGVVANFLSYAAGVIFNDAKGTLALFVQNRTIARAFGRDWDMRLVNYNKGSGTAKDDAAKVVSNTSAPFSVGNADAAIQLITASLGGDGGSANKVFQEAAFALIAALMPALVELRDIGYLKVDPRILRRFTNWDDYCALTENEYVPARVREGLLEFIKSRSGFDPSKPFNKQPEQARQQFGYAQAYFVRQFSTLSESYGNIYMTGSGEVDYRDVFVNNRILVTLLPSLEKSSAEILNLGSLTLNSQKNALSQGLGSTVVGRTADVIDSLSMASNVPSLLITDEASYIIVEGEAVKVAQARGLKVVVLIAAQDFAGLKRANESEAEQIFANTRVKIILSSEADKSTYELVTQIVGQVWVYVKKGLDRVEGSMFGAKRVQASYSLEKMDPVSQDDIRALNEGEGIVFFQEKRHFFRAFFHGFTRQKFSDNVRLVEMLDTEFRPTRGIHAEFLKFSNKRVREDTYRMIESWPEDRTVTVPRNDRINAMREKFDAAIRTTRGPYSPAQIGCMLINCYSTAGAFLEADEPAPEEATSTLLFGNMSGNFGAAKQQTALAKPTPSAPAKPVASANDAPLAPPQAPSVFSQQPPAENPIDSDGVAGRIIDFEDDDDEQPAAFTTAKEMPGAEDDDSDEELDDEFTRSILAAANEVMALHRSQTSEDSDPTHSDDEAAAVASAVGDLLGDDFEQTAYQSEEPDAMCDDGLLQEQLDQPAQPTSVFTSEFIEHVRSSTVEIEKALGKSHTEAVGVGDNWARKIVAETSYPKAKVDKSSLIEAMNDFNRKFTGDDRF